MSTVKENENDEVFEEAKEGGMNTSLTALSIIQLNYIVRMITFDIFHFHLIDILYFVKTRI